MKPTTMIMRRMVRDDDEEEEHNKGANANGDSGSVHSSTFETDTY